MVEKSSMMNRRIKIGRPQRRHSGAIKVLAVAALAGLLSSCGTEPALDLSNNHTEAKSIAHMKIGLSAAEKKELEHAIRYFEISSSREERQAQQDAIGRILRRSGSLNLNTGPGLETVEGMTAEEIIAEFSEFKLLQGRLHSSFTGKKNP